ncbi:MAG: glycosyltransferase [Paludibacter sp.]|nr:glycosyltransferase [Paludibacter sp.]
MRICFISTGDFATIKRATGMANPLIEAGHEVAIIALDSEKNRKRFALECPEAQILYFSSRNVIQEIAQKKHLVKLYQPDLVYICAFVSRNFIHRKNAKTGKRTIFVIEHSELPSAIKNNIWYKKIIDYFLEWSTIFLFDGQLLASKYLENLFKNKLKKIRRKQPLLYSPYAYHKEVLLSEPFLLDKLQKQYENKKVILYMGTLGIKYGFLDILKGVQILNEQRKDFVVLIMGIGKHKEIAEKYVTENNLTTFVKLLGYVSEEELSSYFRIADAFVSPIHNTVQDKARCPSKLFMYIPFQKPVVTCKVGEGESLFGDNGYYYEPHNVEHLSKVLSEAIDTKTLKYDIDPEKHSWNYRTKEFLNWIETNFK